MQDEETYFVVQARAEGNERVFFDPSVIAKNDEDRTKLKKPYWAVGFAAYIFDYGKTGKCVPLVHRTKNHAHKWALIPAGASDNLEELKDPTSLIKRETCEELKIYENGTRICMLDEAKLLTTSKIQIVNISTNEKFSARGELYFTSDKIYLAQAYYVKKNIDNAIFFDGEEDKDKKPLNRTIALVDITDLDGIIDPIAIFKNKKKEKNKRINLDKSADSLDWFRKRAPLFCRAVCNACRRAREMSKKLYDNQKQMK